MSLRLQSYKGAVLRWANGDTSLRSYYLTSFSRSLARRGAIYLFVVEGDSLRDHSDDPRMWSSCAYSMMLNRKFGAAHDAIEVAMSREPQDAELRYWLGLVQWSLGERDSARMTLRRAGV